ncbi:MAG TPA: hypothetical protein ENK28_07670 [Aliiroseovarius sp.]|nr:hypothetical protein [Aliiroseovarius sp.]
MEQAQDMHPSSLKKKEHAHSQVQDKPGLSEPILVIGDVAGWTMSGRDLPTGKNIHFATFQQIESGLFDALKPSAVLSPLLCAQFDCLEVAVQLRNLGFTGRYRAVSRDLPNPWVIRSEVLETCPGMDFDILDVGATDPNRLN